MLEDAEVHKFLDRVEDAFMSGDDRALLNLFSSDEGVTSVGAGLDEFALNRKHLEHLAEREGEPIDIFLFSFGRPKIVLRGELALVTSLVEFRFRLPGSTEERMDIMRMTLALERNAEGEIRILQSHASFPIGDEPPGKVTKPGEENDELAGLEEAMMDPSMLGPSWG